LSLQQPGFLRITIMRARFVLAALMLTLMASAPVHADPPKVAVFDFELVDTSLQARSMDHAVTSRIG
jgi:hypothetical protein